MNSLIAPLADVARRLAPSRFPYPQFALALALGWCGGYVFAVMTLPLPWMLGSMTALTIASILKLPVAAPALIRPPMTAIIGVMLGAAFKPEVIHQLPSWIFTILGLAAFVAASGAACVWYLHKIAGLDRTTAYFAGMPGGLVEMIELGERKGADHNTIALAHSARILLIVFTLPFLVQWLEGVSIGNRSAVGHGLASTSALELTLLAACAIGGAIAGRRLDLPGAYLVGPMIASAVVHVTGISDFVPPREIVNAAQLILGTVLGCRFAGTAPRAILRVIGVSIGSTAILVVLTVIFAVVVGRLTGNGMVPLILAYSPGGLAEMSLVALAVHTDVAFVAGHHIIRILMVMLSAGPIFGIVGFDTGPSKAAMPPGSDPARDESAARDARAADDGAG